MIYEYAAKCGKCAARELCMADRMKWGTPFFSMHDGNEWMNEWFGCECEMWYS